MTLISCWISVRCSVVMFTSVVEVDVLVALLEPLLPELAVVEELVWSPAAGLLVSVAVPLPAAGLLVSPEVPEVVVPELAVPLSVAEAPPLFVSAPAVVSPCLAAGQVPFAVIGVPSGQ